LPSAATATTNSHFDSLRTNLPGPGFRGLAVQVAHQGKEVVVISVFGVDRKSEAHMQHLTEPSERRLTLSPPSDKAMAPVDGVHATLVRSSLFTLAGEQIQTLVPDPAPEVHSLGVRPQVDLEIVVPARNEERRLVSTITASVDHLAHQPWTSAIVVVDNGSSDRTSDIVQGFANSPVPVRGLGCARPGKGAAVRRGMATSAATYVGFMDADLATPIGAIDCVVPLLADGCDAVIGSRHLGTASWELGQPVHRRLGGWAFRQLSRQVLSQFADTQCGFKFFRRDVIAPMLKSARVDGFAFDVEILLYLVRGRHAVVEIPVEWTDAAGSTFSVLRHGWATFHDVMLLSRVGRT
jgi:dolichyl-phosphate beta-glucosyltransferase